MQHHAYVNVSSAIVNSNKTEESFEINAPRYTSYYKNNCTLSMLPVQAYFNFSKYRTKKPILSNNTYVSIKGFLDNVETDTSGHATTFHVSIDNINFLGRAALPQLASSTSDKCFKSIDVFIVSLTMTILQYYHPSLHGLCSLNSILMCLSQAQTQKP